MEVSETIRCDSCRSVECGHYGPIKYGGAMLCPQCYGRSVVAAIEIAEIEEREGKSLYSVEIVCEVEVWATDIKDARLIGLDRFLGSVDPEDMIANVRVRLIDDESQG